jgi:uncharacterized protein YukE
MNFPPLKNVDFAPFLDAVNQVKGHLNRAIGNITDPEVREMFTGLLGEMKSKQANLEMEAPKWKASAEARYAGVIAKFEEATTKKEALLGQLKTLKDDIAVKLETAKAKAAEAAKKPKRVVPRPKVRQKGKSTPLELSPGDVLRNWLVPPAVNNQPATPHIHGNIWENWKAEPTPLPPLDNNNEEEEGE